VSSPHEFGPPEPDEYRPRRSPRQTVLRIGCAPAVLLLLLVLVFVLIATGDCDCAPITPRY
jgi:hypothetical protein